MTDWLHGESSWPRRFMVGGVFCVLAALSVVVAYQQWSHRAWRLTMTSTESRGIGAEVAATLPVLALGLILSAGLALLVALLFKRVDLFRRARDLAVEENEAREAAQSALTLSEARYHSVFDSVTDGLVIMEHDGNILEANDAACRMHGRDPGSLTGESYVDLIEPASTHHWAELREQFGGGRPIQFLSRHLRTDGTVFDVEVRGTTFAAANERPIVAILTDVTERLQAQRRQSMLSRKALMAQEEERARVSRELHDELGQLLTALRIEMGWLAKQDFALSEEAATAFNGSIDLVETAADELRRLCRGLRPPLLDDLGLEPAVRHQVNDFVERTGIDVELDIASDEDDGADAAISMEVALATYRILQESLTNIGRHSGAKRAKITLTRTPTRLRATVVDDGRGFDLADFDAIKGCGVEGMRERARLVIGEIEISSSPHQGTRIAFEAPIGVGPVGDAGGL